MEYVISAFNYFGVMSFGVAGGGAFRSLGGELEESVENFFGGEFSVLWCFRGLQQVVEEE